MTTENLLIELGTEELPPTVLKKLSDVFCEEIVKGLKSAAIDQGDFTPFATPRRLAILIKDVATKQADQEISKKGPHIKTAYDKDGNATKAAMGFAKSCGVSMDDLTTRETDKGEYLYYQTIRQGASTHQLLQGIIEKALKRLPIPKKMRWGERNDEFIRPVHWLIVKLGIKIVPCSILGLVSDSFSKGHRFHHPEKVEIGTPESYERSLKETFVISSFEKRKNQIEKMATQVAQAHNTQAVIDADLLMEVTGLVEYPVAILGEFEEKFLDMPPEVLIKTMQDNQKYFPLKGKDGKLTNKFITISNIQSKDEQQVKQGNERVVRPRLADAEFFWNMDRKQKLEDFNDSLKMIVFQKQLGTVFDKVQRISILSKNIATQVNADEQKVQLSAKLCKCDLMTAMVGEFASLQGVIGQYYARHDGLDDEVAKSIFEHYLPRYAGDRLPTTKSGQVISLADKFDTLCGIFAIGQKPTGMKDPFALRRASLGILRIIIELKLSLDLQPLITQALFNLPVEPVEDAEQNILDYLFDRYKNYYVEQGFDAKTVIAVLKLKPTQPLDFDKRIRAVNLFITSDAANSLAASNKRISNILKKQPFVSTEISKILLTEKSELMLYAKLQEVIEKNLKHVKAQNYQQILNNLSSLHNVIDDFFENVMVMVDDEKVKNNRLALLHSLSSQFMQVADISGL